MLILHVIATNGLIFSTVARNVESQLCGNGAAGTRSRSRARCDGEVKSRRSGRACMRGRASPSLGNCAGFFIPRLKEGGIKMKAGETVQLLGKLSTQAHTCTHQGIRATPLCLHHPPPPPPPPSPASCCADLAGLRRGGSGCCLPPQSQSSICVSELHPHLKKKQNTTSAPNLDADDAAADVSWINGVEIWHSVTTS